MARNQQKYKNPGIHFNIKSKYPRNLVFGMKFVPIYPSQSAFFQADCSKIASHVQLRKTIRIQEDKEKDEVVENTLEILGSSVVWGGGKCIEMWHSTCVGCTPLVVSKVTVKWWFVVGCGCCVCVLFLCCFVLIFGAKKSKSCASFS